MTGTGSDKEQESVAKRIGILGGTFDPIHYAHLRVAEESYERLQLEKVLLVLSATPPHKGTEGVTPFEVRWKMLKAVCEKNPRLSPVDIEAQRTGPSYTKDTIRAIQELHGPEVELMLLVGMDCAIEFTTWKSYEEILETSSLVVFGRPGEDANQIDPSLRDRMTLLEWDEMGVSSTRIRKKVSEGKSIRYLVPTEIEEIIERENLYRMPTGLSDPSSANIAPGEVVV